MSLSGWSSLCELSSALALRSDPRLPAHLTCWQPTRDLIAITGDQAIPPGRGSASSRISSQIVSTLACNPTRSSRSRTWAAAFLYRWW
jgi:hypothetical protein